MAKDLVHQELQRDEVAEGIHEIVEKLERHRHLLVGLVLVGVVAVIAAVAYRNSAQSKVDESSNLIIETMNRYSTFERQSLPDDRKRSFDDTVAAINSLQTEFPGTRMANLGEFIKGRLEYDMGQSDKAGESFAKCLADAKTPEEKAQAEIALGYNEENASFLIEDQAQRKTHVDASMQHYNNAVKLVPSGQYLGYYAQLGIARLYELTDENQKALDLLKELSAHPPLAGPEKKPADVKTGDDPVGDALRVSLLNFQDQIRLGATTDLRLKRLEAKMGIAEKVETTTVKQ